uniref:PWI domain-containing protein n=1 Tax=Alexandrium andersonii TaxID=327968 RepID=A0A7S2J5Q3_9DINO
MDNDANSTRLGPLIPEKKPRIYLLVTKLAPELDEGRLQQIIEQCGEVQAFRRGRDADGKPLSFGFAQFGDPEAAWKASTCLSKRVLCGQEIKVLVEEHAEGLIQQWRRSQQAALRVSTDEELDWELERKAVSCKASIDAKVEEIFGAPEDGSGAGAVAQRSQELREREQQRITRLKKRKAWREQEFARELERIETAEKRLRKEEVDKDDSDRDKEQVELREKERKEAPNGITVSRAEDAPGSRAKTIVPADNRKLVDMVDTVQAEPRDAIFRMELNASFLRNEQILETKLRPWLERKVDLCMGGPQSDLVEYILRRVNGCCLPDSLISELTRYLDDNADPLVERMWRMLVFELMRGGFALTESAKKREGGQHPQ